MFLKPVVKALLVLSLTGAAHARVVPGQADQLQLSGQFDMAEHLEHLEQLQELQQAVMAEQAAMADEAEQGELVEEDKVDTDDLAKSLPISYGKCYHIKRKSEYLGHNHANLLQFGAGSVGLFQVCKSKSSCAPNQPNKVVQSDQKFILYDLDGYEKSYIVAANYLLRPHTGVLKDTVIFEGKKEHTGEGYAVRLRAQDETLGIGGLTVNNYKFLWLSSGNYGNPLVYFEETGCPS